MPGGDTEKLIDAILKARDILFPRQIMQKDAHGVHSQRFGPTKFAVDLCWIEGFRLPHLQFVRRVRWHEVRAQQQRLPLVPLIRLRLTPPLLLAGKKTTSNELKFRKRIDIRVLFTEIIFTTNLFVQTNGPSAACYLRSTEITVTL